MYLGQHHKTLPSVPLSRICPPHLQPLQDLPAMLERQPELEHYSESVVFEDRLSPRLGLPAASCAGKEAYSRLCWSLRFHRTLFFSKAKVGGRVDTRAGACGDGLVGRLMVPANFVDC